MTSQLDIGISVLQYCYLKPGVLQSLVDGQPLTGVDDQQPPHQIFGCYEEIHSECCGMVTAVCQQSRSSTFVRDMLPLGWKHREFSANYLLCDGQIPKVLMEWRVTAQTERQEDNGVVRQAEVGGSRQVRVCNEPTRQRAGRRGSTRPQPGRSPLWMPG